MPISLHAATVPSMLQILGSAKGWLTKAADCTMAENEIVESCLIDDMLPFAYQIKSIAVHSMGAFEGVKAGSFQPDMNKPPMTFEALRQKLEEATAYLEALSVDEVEAMVGQPMKFEVPQAGKEVPFVAEDFLLSFSQPNFYFHAVTAYGILRANGIDVGKLDYLGQLRVAGS